MNSPHPRHLRRVIEAALRPSRPEASPLGAAVRRLAAQLQKQASGRLSGHELVELVVSWISQRRSCASTPGGPWPTAVLQDTHCNLVPRFSA